MSTTQSNNQNQNQSVPQDDLQKKIDESKRAAEQEKKQQTTNPKAASPASTQFGTTPPTNDVATLKLQLEKMTEMAKRTMADLQNLKRRQEEEKHLIFQMANIDLIRSLLPIVDNLDRAIKHMPDSAKPSAQREGAASEESGSAGSKRSELINIIQWTKGLEICSNQLKKALTEAGLKPIESLNQPFNPEFHEALAQGPGPKDTVIEELEKGYMLGDRVIRHAKVKVGNGEK